MKKKKLSLARHLLTWGYVDAKEVACLQMLNTIMDQHYLSFWVKTETIMLTWTEDWGGKRQLGRTLTGAVKVGLNNQTARVDMKKTFVLALLTLSWTAFRKPHAFVIL